MRIYVWMLLLVVLVGCASAPAPAVTADDAWLQCVRLAERAMYQERDYMRSLGLPYHYQTLEALWAPCDELKVQAAPVEVRDEPDPDRTSQMLGLMLLNQVFGPRR